MVADNECSYVVVSINVVLCGGWRECVIISGGRPK